MTVDRIKDLMNKGYITRVEDPAELVKMTESELMEKGYITQIGVFDGSDDTTEEVPVEATPAVAMDDDTTTPADDVTDPDETVDPDDAPVVDDGNEPVEE